MIAGPVSKLRLVLAPHLLMPLMLRLHLEIGWVDVANGEAPLFVVLIWLRAL